MLSTSRPPARHSMDPRGISDRHGLQQPPAQLATAVSTLVVATTRSRAGQRVPRSNAAQTRISFQLEVPAVACSSWSGMHMDLIRVAGDSLWKPWLAPQLQLCSQRLGASTDQRPGRPCSSTAARTLSQASAQHPRAHLKHPPRPACQLRSAACRMHAACIQFSARPGRPCAIYPCMR